MAIRTRIDASAALLARHDVPTWSESDLKRCVHAHLAFQAFVQWMLLPLNTFEEHAHMWKTDRVLFHDLKIKETIESASWKVRPDLSRYAMLWTTSAPSPRTVGQFSPP